METHSFGRIPATSTPWSPSGCRATSTSQTTPFSTFATPGSVRRPGQVGPGRDAFSGISAYLPARVSSRRQFSRRLWTVTDGLEWLGATELADDIRRGRRSARAVLEEQVARI